MELMWMKGKPRSLEHARRNELAIMVIVMAIELHVSIALHVW